MFQIWRSCSTHSHWKTDWQCWLYCWCVNDRFTGTNYSEEGEIVTLLDSLFLQINAALSPSSLTNVSLCLTVFIFFVKKYCMRAMIRLAVLDKFSLSIAE